MAYELAAILGRQAVLERYQNWYRSARVVPLKLGWAIIPLTSHVWRELNRATEPRIWDSSGADIPGPRRLTAWLEAMSRDDVVAQIESECFGNVCGDEATVWQNGRIVLGPLRGGAMSDDFSPLVINQALRFMGVSREPSTVAGLDEFDIVGLGRHRKTNQWVEEQPSSG